MSIVITPMGFGSAVPDSKKGGTASHGRQPDGHPEKILQVGVL
jgi:hypothetical protein